MASSKDRNGSVAMVIMASLLFCQLNISAAAPTTSVIGWDVAPSLDPVGVGRTAVGKVLTVCKGDSVKFNWQANHGVVQSKLISWNTCNLAAGAYVTKAPISPSGSWTTRMSTPGARYYYCPVPGHCAMGQKVKIVTKPRRC